MLEPAELFVDWELELPQFNSYQSYRSAAVSQRLRALVGGCLKSSPSTLADDKNERDSV
jgi:hypothetical protein